MPGILSGLEVCTGIVACCTITYRPLVEKFFRSPSSDAPASYGTGRSGGSQRGWNKIGVQMDSMPSKGSHTHLTSQQA